MLQQTKRRIREDGSETWMSLTRLNKCHPTLTSTLMLYEEVVRHGTSLSLFQPEWWTTLTYVMRGAACKCALGLLACETYVATVIVAILFFKNASKNCIAQRHSC